ncbi:MAG TPA: oxygen-independent coproporphyrinogen III oxidase [Ferrovibrio sp.]|uniref:oxygen-independent coproporphyrinogen III oxidase n=1 Tax=Ferrovibrio sp. TaxID=1917215 RepID=UPI002ED3479D
MTRIAPAETDTSTPADRRWLAELASLAQAIGPVPRYTSYPTAPHFRAVAEDTDWRRQLSELTDGGAFALYVHIPFCRQMCWYCGCHTQITKNADALERYVRYLLREIEAVGALLPRRPRLSGLHFGGGTPTILAAEGLRRITDRLFERFALQPGAEIAIEIDPRHCDHALARGLAAMGVNRASLGVQSLDEQVQRAVNRIQPFEDILRSTDALREAGIAGINFDLLYGLPHQTVANVTDTVERCLTLRPDRLALFGYAHVPWMKPHQARIDAAALPDTAERFAQEAAAGHRLMAAGYRRIGLDHFSLADDPLARHAQSGTLHRNFQGYTTEVGEVLLGFGTSAISTLPEGYAQNIPAVAAWRQALDNGRLPVARMRHLSPEDRLRRAVIEQLMCHLQVDLAALAAGHGQPAALFDSDLERLEPLMRHDVVRRDGYRVIVPDIGRPLLRQVSAVFDAYLAQSAGVTPRHAAA